MRLFIVLLLATVACAAAPAATAPTLAGRVTVAAGEPQCSPKGCGAPLAPTTLRFTRNGHVRTVKTAPAAPSAPGCPRAPTASRPGLDGAAISPVRVTVRAGVTRRVTFVLRLNAA